MDHIAPEFPDSHEAKQARETLMLQLRKRNKLKLEEKLKYNKV